MDIVSEVAADRGQDRHRIEIADATLNFRSVSIADLTPTGEQLAAAACFKPAQQVTVLQVLANGDLEDVRPDETVDLRHAEGRFVIVESDRSYRLTIDGQRFDWPCRVVSGGLLRKLGQVPAEKEILLAESETADRAIGPHDLIDLDAAGVETFVTRVRHWKLNVQGVVVKFDTPTIGVRDAIARAGFNPDQGWQIFLKIAGHPKRAVTLIDTIDLRAPGIEKLRLTPNEVNNGEAPWTPRQAFDLLEADHDHLERLGLRWETVEQVNRRWLLLHYYPLPVGYSVTHTLLALEIPPTYPGAQIYGFYAFPPLALESGRAIDNTQLRGMIDEREFHGWSRNRGSLAWNAATDNLSTQLMLVDAALAKEVGE
jgi:hypothetical protein